MVPKKNCTITLYSINICDSKWVVKVEVSAVVEEVEAINNNKVGLLATINGRQYYCERAFYPSTIEELRTAVWKPVSGRSSAIETSLFVEAVVAFNVHRELGMKPVSLVCNREVRTTVVPHANNAYCATHDLVSYWGEKCPKCTPAGLPVGREKQTA